MDEKEIQQKVEAFLQSLGIPSFIVFGWKKGADPNVKGKEQFGLISSFHKMPTNAAVKGMSWALNDFVSRTL